MLHGANRYDYFGSIHSSQLSQAQRETDFYKNECKRLHRIIDVCKTAVGIATLGLITALLFLLEKHFSYYLSQL